MGLSGLSDTGSMGDFHNAADLDKYLIEISPRYSKYATDLWNSNIRSCTELANVSVTTLAKCGVSNIAHAENIEVHVKNAEMGAPNLSIHRHQVERILNEWLRELEERKDKLMRSRPIAEHTPLLSQHDVSLKDLSEEISQVITYTRMALQQQDWLDIYHDVIRLAKVDLDRKTDLAMLVSQKKTS